MSDRVFKHSSKSCVHRAATVNVNHVCISPLVAVTTELSLYRRHTHFYILTTVTRQNFKLKASSTKLMNSTL